MSLAFAVGAKSVSSRPIVASDDLEELAEDGTRLLPVLPACDADPFSVGDRDDDVGTDNGTDHDDENDDDDRDIPRVHFTTCLSSDQELQAVVTVTHYDMVWEGTQVQDSTVACLRIQILPAFEALSTRRYRETLHRIKLPVKDQNKQSRRMQFPDARLVAVFSADKLRLACLIPYYPAGSPDSAVVVFQLRRPRSESNSSSARPSSPTLPSYLHLPARPVPIAPVATNPKIVPQTLNAQVSDLEDVAYRGYSGETASAATVVPSILLAGCCDGTVLAVSYRPLAVAGTFFESTGSAGDDDDGAPSAGIRQLRHVSDPICHPDAEERTGVLAVVRFDGSVTLCRTRMVAITGSPSAGSAAHDDVAEDHSHSSSGPASNAMNDQSDRSRAAASHANFAVGPASAPHSLYLSIRPVGTLERQFCYAAWLSSSSYLALVSAEQEGIDRISPSSKNVVVEVWGLSDELSSSLLSRWEMTWHRLLEGGHHSSYKADEDQSSDAQHVLFAASTVSLNYDTYSDCIAISAYVSDVTGQLRVQRTFVCTWWWRQNCEGLLMTQTQPSPKVTPSFLMFAKSRDGRRRLIHTLAVRDFHGPRVRKDSYDSEVLSSGTEGPETPDRLARMSNLLVGSTTVSYPVVEIVSSAGEFEIEWRDARIPLDYSLAQGAPRLAAIGGRNCGSVAIAASAGLCVLDCGKSFVSRHNESQPNGDELPNRLPRVLPCRMKPRWHRFGSESEEVLFRVISMLWWEGVPHSDDWVVSSDLLVALIDVDDARVKGRYLACWTQQDLDFDHQLLFSDDDAALVAGNLQVDEIPRFGVRIPDDFAPTSLDLLVEPGFCQTSSSPNRRKAVLLLSDASKHKAFLVYHLQVARWSPRRAISYKDMLPFIVLSQCVSFGTIRDASAVFLASASFSFALEDDGNQPDEGDCVVALGVVPSSGGGVEAVAVSRQGEIASSMIVAPNDQRSNSELVRYWMADMAQENASDHCAVQTMEWLLEMSNGSLHVWSVPIMDTDPNQTKSLDANDMLGRSSFAKETSYWMQQNGIGPRRIVPLSSVPRDFFGSELGTEQVCRKMHRSLGEAFEKQLFRADFLEHETMTVGDFVLSIPRSLPSLYAQLSASNESQERLSAFDWKIHRRIATSTYRDHFLVSLQLMFLRAVESRARTAHDSGLLENLARSLKYILSPLQFSLLVLDVGRQMEPGLLQYLFPLRVSANQKTTTLGLFYDTLVNGSITGAASALPLFGDHGVLRLSCLRILKHCLDAVCEASRDPRCSGFESCPEERLLLRDIFHYALKLDGSCREDEEDLTSDVDEESSHDSSSSEARNYSMICGVSRVFRRRPSSAPVLLNGNGTTLQNGGRRQTESGYRVVSQMILLEVLQSPSVMAWKRSYALATLLVGESTNGMHLCDAEAFFRHLQRTNLAALSSGDKALVNASDAVALLARHTHDCHAALQSSESSVLLDLVLLLLGSPKSSEDSDSAAPGLLLLAIVTGHHCERTTEFLSLASLQHPIFTAYEGALGARE